MIDTETRDTTTPLGGDDPERCDIDDNGKCAIHGDSGDTKRIVIRAEYQDGGAREIELLRPPPECQWGLLSSVSVVRDTRVNPAQLLNAIFGNGDVRRAVVEMPWLMAHVELQGELGDIVAIRPDGSRQTVASTAEIRRLRDERAKRSEPEPGDDDATAPGTSTPTMTEPPPHEPGVPADPWPEAPTPPAEPTAVDPTVPGQPDPEGDREPEPVGANTT